MSIKLRFKKLTLLPTAASILLVGTVSSAWAKTNLTELHNELEIMSSIVQTAMAQGSDEKGIRLRSLNVTYLAGQGVVFELDSQLQRRQFEFSFRGDSEFIVVPDLAPIPPLPPLPGIADNEHELIIELDDEDWSEAVEESLRFASGEFSKANEKLRELQQQERENAWEQREYKRQLRDVEFEMRNADAQRKAELQEQKLELEQEIAELNKRQTGVDKYAKQLQTEQKQKVAQQLAKRKQQYTEFLSNFEDNIATTLCKYGNGIKALSTEENVSFVLSNLGTAEKGGSQDRIYVFKNKDIQSCVKDKISPQQLLTKADAYLF